MRFLLSNKFLPLLCLFTFAFSALFSQTTNISGVINSYAEVISVDQANACVELSPTTPLGLNLNDRVLLIQMQGALMDETNSANFGTISLLNGAGAYEMGVVCSVTGTTICFQYDLVNNYNQLGASDAKIQLIPIPSYPGDVNVTGALTGQAWDGDVGGVLIFEAAGTVTLNADVSMDGKGFRGGLQAQSTYNCTGVFGIPKGAQTDFFYDVSDQRGAWKGEGVTGYIAGKELGQGKQSNGGGGGNDHNTGGGGGSNYGTGGQGGTRTTTSAGQCPGTAAGRPGNALAGLGYTAGNNYIFMGGGGGSGHDNSNEGKAGANGGGIIIIMADQIDGNSHTITANGDNAEASGSDGAPGGGAGGAILINSNTFSGNPLTLEARGGNGGNSSTIGIDCMGPGGGGGGGAIWTFAALPGTATTSVAGGTNGIIAISAASPPVCNGATNGASSGLVGSIQTALNIPEETVNNSPCILAPRLLAFTAVPEGRQVRLHWQVTDAAAYRAFDVARSIDGLTFEDLFTLPVMPADRTAEDFAWTDRQAPNGISYYRLRLTDLSGAVSYSDRVEVRLALDNADFFAQVFPNPTATGQMPYLEVAQPGDGPARIQIHSLAGQVLTDRVLDQPAGTYRIGLGDLTLPAGTYLVSVRWAGRTAYSKLVLID